MSTLTLELTTPERIVLKESYDSATIPTADGEITVLPGHVPLVSTLKPGMITVRRGAQASFLAVSGGFVEVMPDGRVVLLADTADRAEELDLEKVEAARERARELLEAKRDQDDVSSAAAVAALERELARVRVARHHRSRRVPGSHAETIQ
jgi:F-type H+-transporting ATPase subunit epsilon